MKNLKLAIAALIISLSAIQAKAQEKTQLTEEQKQEMKAQFEENKKRLALTPEQETSFKEIAKKYAPEMKAVKDSEIDRSEKHKKMKDLRDRKNEEIKAILSEKQYQTYLEIQKERKQRMKEKKKENKQTKE